MRLLAGILPVFYIILLSTHCAAAGLLAAKAYSLNSSPEAAATADFNQDGRADLATANSDGTVAVLLANDSGGFRNAKTYPAGKQCSAITATDLDGNGIPDLVAICDTNIIVMLGNGDGTFRVSTSPVGVAPVDVVAADFDGDGKIDVAVADCGSSDFCILPLSSSTSGPPCTVVLLLGKGDGTFRSSSSWSAGQSPYGLAVSDLNRDGKPDLVVGDLNFFGGKVPISVLLGNGDGTFQPAISVPINRFSAADSLAAADVNGDGIPDLAVAAGNNTVYILLGHGDGTFQVGNGYVIPGFPAQQLQLADLDGDGLPDLIAATDRSVTVLRGMGAGNFTRPITYGAGARFVITGQFGPNGAMAIAAGGTFEDTVNVAVVNPRATLGAPFQFETGTTGLAAGDFTNDGKMDLATLNGNNVELLPGRGDGTFASPLTTTLLGAYTRSIRAADFNVDGKLDLSVTDDHGLEVLLGKGDGTFQFVQSIALPVESDEQVTADFNHDGHPDIAVTQTLGNVVTIFIAKADGTFQTGVDYTVGNTPGRPLVADLNGDGNIDLMVGTASGNLLLFGNGDGTFQPPVALSIVAALGTVADFNGDGKQDLAVWDYTGTSIAFGNGDGTFQTPVRVTPDFGYVLAVDLNRDGKPDLVLSGGETHVELNKGSGTFQRGAAYFAGIIPTYAVTADFNGDSVPDFATFDVYSNDLLVIFGIK